MPQFDKLITYAQNLVHVHLGHAVDACIIAKRYSDPAVDGLRPLQNRYAISSVIRGYAGLEGVAYWMRFELFDNRDSKHYCDPASESPAVQQIAKDVWQRRVALERKLDFLFDRKQTAFDPKLQERVRDVRLLRNVLAHGWIAETLFEMGRTDDGFVTIKDSFTDFKGEWSTLKFNSPHELTHQDAQMALRVVLEATRCVFNAYERNAPVPMYEVELTEWIGAGERRDSVGHIMQIICESPTRPSTPTAQH